MHTEKTKIQFTASRQMKITRDFIQGVLSVEFENFASHASIHHIETTRIFPGQECQIFGIEIDNEAFSKENPVEDSNQLVHDMLHTFKEKGVDLAPSAFIAQKSGPFYRRDRLRTSFENTKEESIFSVSSFLHDGYPIEPSRKDNLPGTNP